VLDIRLLLDFEPTFSGRGAENDLVASRMRTAHSVPAHREYMRSSYPSEPVLAEAAARIWEKYRKQETATRVGEASDLVIPKILQGHLMSSLIGKGERGELVARLILTLAYDAAVRKSGPGLRTRAVPLQAFLEELFGEHYATIANSTPNIGSVKFSEAFKDAQVRFSHFARAGDDSAVSTVACCAAILRSMAFQCTHNQRAIDIVIPVAFKNEALKESTMTGILISVRDRVQRSTWPSLDIDASNHAFFPPKDPEHPDKRPYISIVMELGIPPKKPATTKSRRTGKQPSKKPKIGPGSFCVGGSDLRRSPRSEEPEHPQYSYYAYGCSPSIYKAVASEDVFASLLSSRTWLDEHPRQSSPFLQDVKKQKPFWSRGPEFYGWLGDAAALR